MYFFSQHTPRGSLERMMRAVPRPTFRLGSGPGVQLPEKSGKPSCRDCVSYRRGEGCLLAACPYLADRLAAGAVSYAELVKSVFPLNKYSRLGGRLSRLTARVGGFRFRSEPHRSRMAQWLEWADPRASPQWLAAVYLLSARKALWMRVRTTMSRWSIRWDSTTLGSLDPQSYALYRAAKGIWNGGLDIHPLELEDPDLIHDDTLLLIANALLLVQYGRAVMTADRKSSTNRSKGPASFVEAGLFDAQILKQRRNSR